MLGRTQPRRHPRARSVACRFPTRRSHPPAGVPLEAMPLASRTEPQGGSGAAVGRPSSPRVSSAALAAEHGVLVSRPRRRGASSPIRRAAHQADFDRSARHGHRLSVEPRFDGVHLLHLEHSGVTPHRAKRDAIHGRREQHGGHKLAAPSTLSPSDHEHSQPKRARLAERTKLLLKDNRLGSSVRARDPQALDGREPTARERCDEQGRPEG